MSDSFFAMRLRQTLDLGLRVYQPGHGHEQREFADDGRGRLRRGFARREQPDALEAGEPRADSAKCSSSQRARRVRRHSRSSSGILREGAMSISPRIWRTARMNCFIHATSASACGIARVIGGRRVGRQHDAVGDSFALRARHLAAAVSGATSGFTRCQISSVMNGIIGCSARSSASSSVDQRAARAALLRLGRGLALQHRLGELEVPVAELVPGEFVQRGGREVEAVFAQRTVDLRERGGEARDDPAVGDRQLDVADQATARRCRGPSGPPSSISTKRAAFHSLLQKLR